MTNNRKRTINDVERDRAGLRKRIREAHSDAAAKDAKSRFENQQSGRQTERSEHLALGPAGGIVDSRAGAGRRAKEQREADRRAGIVRGRPPWA